MKFTRVFLMPALMVLLSCNLKNNSETKDIENLSDTITSRNHSNGNSAIKSTNEINAEILNKYVVGDFIVQTYLERPIMYAENGVISCLNLITKETNNQRSIYYNETHSMTLYFFENGKLQMKTEYLGREKHGEWIRCYDNGNTSDSSIYVKGSKEGTWIAYYKNGVVNSKISYLDNKRHGVFEYYLNNGKLQKKAEYRNGIAVGNSFVHYDNGKIEETCSDELEERICKRYNVNGKISQIVKYYLTGVIKNSIEYNENGDISNERFFDENGNEIDNRAIEKSDENGNEYTVTNK